MKKYILLLIFVVCIGCSNYSCPDNHIFYDNACCLDENNNNVCDSEDNNSINKEVDKNSEEENIVNEKLSDDTLNINSETEQQETIELSPEYKFASKFVDAWNQESYKALHSLFVEDIRFKYSNTEFNFLGRKYHNNLEIQGINLLSVENNVAEYEIIYSTNTEIVNAMIVDEDGLKHESFLFFQDLDPNVACAEDPSCYYNYALISKNKNYCKKAGDKKEDCDIRLGSGKSLSSKISECNSLNDYFSKADCLTQVAEKENNIEPCWDAGEDRQVYGCMGKVAAIRSDVDLCKEFAGSKGFPGTKVQIAHCILAYAQKTEDTSACLKIDRRGDVLLGSMTEACYSLEIV